jgi:threonine dehydratase
MRSPWPLLQPMIDGSIVVSLDQVKAAMKRTAERVHVVAEGAAGCAVAAAVSGRVPGRRIVAIVSGGNIDLAKFAALVT